MDFGSRRWAVEVKLTASPGLDDLRRLNRAADLIDADTRVLISQTRRAIRTGRQVSCSLPWLLRRAFVGPVSFSDNTGACRPASDEAGLGKRLGSNLAPSQ